MQKHEMRVTHLKNDPFDPPFNIWQEKLFYLTFALKMYEYFLLVYIALLYCTSCTDLGQNVRAAPVKGVGFPIIGVDVGSSLHRAGPRTVLVCAGPLTTSTGAKGRIYTGSSVWNDLA